jgi:hypothetical protein
MAHQSINIKRVTEKSRKGMSIFQVPPIPYLSHCLLMVSRMIGQIKFSRERSQNLQNIIRAFLHERIDDRTLTAVNCLIHC